MNIDLDYILFKTEQNYIKNDLGNELWIKVHGYSHYEDNEREDDVAFHCGIIKHDAIEKSLDNPRDWEIYQDQGFPGCTRYGLSEDSEVVYNRFGGTEAEPLIFKRSYKGFRDSHPEISEEFRLFHNLYHDLEKNEFVKFDESGTPNSVIKFENNSVLIRLKEIRQFLAIKEACLALYFEYIRYSKINIYHLKDERKNYEYRDKNTAYSMVVYQPSDKSKYKIMSSIRGKKVILPYPKSKSDFWPYNEANNKVYQTFIIDENADGEKITFTCEPDKLANYFGANPDAPNYLTPVYFKRDVLVKYYADPDKYSVKDSNLRCGDSWLLKMDNHHEDVVIVYLGDLSSLPAEEQDYWKVYNIVPRGSLSKTNFARDFLCIPSDPEDKALRFKSRYEQLNKEWKINYGWYLFRPLSPGDEHFWKNLRVPLNNSQAEFDNQIIALTKILIDSLNEHELKKHIEDSPKDAKGIKKLSIFFNQQNFEDYENDIELLMNIQSIRSNGVAHLKGSKYQKLAKRLGLSNQNLQKEFSDLLKQATIFLDKLISHLGFLQSIKEAEKSNDWVSEEEFLRALDDVEE